MTAAQIPAEGAAIVYRVPPKEPTMTDTDQIPTTDELLAAFLRLACEFRTDYRAATAARTAAIKRVAEAIEDATDARVL